MVQNPGVIFDQVWKKFRRGERHDSLRDLVPSVAAHLFRRKRVDVLKEQEFWAVRDVSFEVRAGEALGIIGPNGAGKSTILKLLTRILRPTTGHCTVHGRVGALIEVAAGFHPDLTGRENVYLQGSIMGMKQVDIAKHFDAIVEFGGVGDFIDTPVKRYSSGMNARLGFAIAAHLDPDVLLIDEVLSVGDASFQDKCVARMRELITTGIPLVFISHNLPAVMDLCTRVIVLRGGKVAFEGTPGDAVQHYRIAPHTSTEPEEGKRPSGPIQIRKVELLDEHGKRSMTFRSGRPMIVRIHYRAIRSVEPTFHVDIYRADGLHCTGVNTFMDRQPLGVVNGAGYVDLTIPDLPLLPSCYMISVWILDGGAIEAYDKQLFAYPFTVISDQRGVGHVHLRHGWNHVTGGREAATDSFQSIKTDSFQSLTDEVAR